MFERVAKSNHGSCVDIFAPVSCTSTVESRLAATLLKRPPDHNTANHKVLLADNLMYSSHDYTATLSLLSKTNWRKSGENNQFPLYIVYLPLLIKKVFAKFSLERRYTRGWY